LGNGFEAVLVDDGSTDGTVEEARQAARRLGLKHNDYWKIKK